MSCSVSAVSRWTLPSAKERQAPPGRTWGIPSVRVRTDVARDSGVDFVGVRSDTLRFPRGRRGASASTMSPRTACGFLPGWSNTSCWSSGRGYLGISYARTCASEPCTVWVTHMSIRAHACTREMNPTRAPRSSYRALVQLHHGVSWVACGSLRGGRPTSGPKSDTPPRGVLRTARRRISRTNHMHAGSPSGEEAGTAIGCSMASTVLP